MAEPSRSASTRTRSGAPGRHQVPLADDLVEGARPQPGGQRGLAAEAAVRRGAEEVRRRPCVVPAVVAPSGSTAGRPPRGRDDADAELGAAASGASGLGAPVMGSAPDWVFGKAMTSRMFSSPAKMATSRSTPTAKPPWGGAP